MKFGFAFFVAFFAGALSFASSERPALRALISYGTEFRAERDLENRVVGHQLQNYALGTGYQDFIFILEHITFKESSGNSTLFIERSLENTLLWAQWQSQTWMRLVPYLGGGLGAYQEKVTTTFADVSSSTRASNPKLLTGFNFGVRLDIPLLWLSFETRLLFGDELDQQPTTGALLRLGLYF